MSARILSADTYLTNAEMIEAVAKLGRLRHTDLVLDPTYGQGTWWKRWQPDTLVASDLHPRPSAPCRRADFTALPHPDATFDVVAFDPPYKLNGTPTPTVDDRYGVGVSTRWQDRHALIREGITECIRVLKPKGVLLVKCQDQVCSGQVRWQTIEFTNHATAQGLRLADMLHKLGGRPQPKKRRQVHAAHNYSTLLIFKKR